MKRVVLRVFFILFTFSAGIFITCAWFNFYSKCGTAKNDEVSVDANMLVNKSAANENEATNDLPILSFCELANNPKKYDGKIVRLSAALNMMNIHGYTTYDYAKCSENGEAENKQAAVRFSNEQDSEKINNIFKENLSKMGWYKPVNFIARAKFSYVRLPIQASDSVWDRTSLHLEILNLETFSLAME